MPIQRRFEKLSCIKASDQRYPLIHINGRSRAAVFKLDTGNRIREAAVRHGREGFRHPCSTLSARFRAPEDVACSHACIAKSPAGSASLHCLAHGHRVFSGFGEMVQMGLYLRGGLLATRKEKRTVPSDTLVRGDASLFGVGQKRQGQRPASHWYCGGANPADHRRVPRSVSVFPQGRESATRQARAADRGW